MWVVIALMLLPDAKNDDNVSVAILTCIVNPVDRFGPPAGLSARYWNGSDERLRNLVRLRSMSYAWGPCCGLHRRPIATRSIS